MIALYKDPLGENIFSQNTVQQASSLGVEAVVNKEKINVLQRRVTALQEELLNAKVGYILHYQQIWLLFFAAVKS